MWQTRVLMPGDATLTADQQPTPRARQMLTPGTVLDRYVLQRYIGSGGMGEVYGAYDFALERTVALKVQSSSNPQDVRYLDEAKAMARLHHPNVVSVHDVGEAQGVSFVAMQMVEGSNLKQWLEGEPRTWQQVVTVFTQAGRGLAAAHNAGLVHGDFKPENVLIDIDGMVRVADFGLSRPAHTSLSGAGTPGYMAPEVQRGAQADSASDQWAFCKALGNALSETGAPTRVLVTVTKGLAENPFDRFASMEALLSRLSKAAVPRTRIAAMVLGPLAVVTALAIGGTWYANRDQRLCGDGDPLLLEIWNPEQSKVIQAAFAKSDFPHAKTTSQWVLRSFDKFATDYRDSYKKSCLATRVQHVQSEALFELQKQCLHVRLSQAQALVKALRAPTRMMIERAPDAADKLSLLSDCQDAEKLARQKPPYLSGQMRTQVDGNRAQINEGVALGILGEVQKSIAILEPAAQKARELGDHEGNAMALTGLARGQLNSKKWKDAEKTAFQALVEAGAIGDDIQAVQAAEIGGSASSNFDSAAADRWIELANTFAQRSSSDRARGIAARLRAYVYTRSGRYQDGVAAARIAAQIDPTPRASYELAAALSALDRPQEALAELDKALESLMKRYGPQHRAAISLRTLRAMVLTDLNRLQESEREYRVVLSVADSWGLGKSTLVNDIGNFSETLCDLGKSAEAVQLTRETLAAIEKEAEPDSFPVGSAALGLGAALACADKKTEALPYINRAATILGSKKGNWFITYTLALQFQAKLLTDLGQPAKALPIALKCLKERIGQQAGPLVIADARVQVARALEALGKDPKWVAEERKLARAAFEASPTQGPRRIQAMDRDMLPRRASR